MWKTVARRNNWNIQNRRGSSMRARCQIFNTFRSHRHWQRRATLSTQAWRISCNNYSSGSVTRSRIATSRWATNSRAKIQQYRWAIAALIIWISVISIIVDKMAKVAAHNSSKWCSWGTGIFSCRRVICRSNWLCKLSEWQTSAITIQVII